MEMNVRQPSEISLAECISCVSAEDFQMFYQRL